MIRVLEWCFRLIAGGAFIYAAISKIMVPCELAMDMYQYQLAPGFLLNIGAIVLPYVEIILGGCLIFGLAPRGAALGISFVLIFFIILLSINTIRGIDFDCGCFGSAEGDSCNELALKIKANHPEMDRITFVRIRTCCDIFRDLLLLICSWGAYLLICKRENTSNRRVTIG